MTPPPQAIFLPALLLFFAPLTIALTNATKLPFYAPTDTTKFLGNDGFWSTVTLRVGTPPQPIFVHPFLSTSLILVPNSVWCSNLTYSGYSCDSRGRGFSTSLSSTWRPIGQYDLDIRPELEDDRVIYGVTDLGYGEFGEDVVMMKEGDDAGREVSVQEIAVGAVNDSTVLLGELGLGVDVRSFDAQTTSEGMLGKLWKTGQIPGRSFGYTAGNYYR